MKFLFVGGTSYLGRELIKEFGPEHTVSVLIRNEASKSKLQGLQTQLVFENELESLPMQDVVFNLVVDYGKGKQLSEVFETNVMYPLKTLEKLKFKSLINFSTGLEKTVSNYSLTKNSLEEFLVQWSKSSSWQIINLKLQHFYGPGAPDHNFVTFLVKQLLNNQDIPLTDCKQKRDFIYIEDVIQAVTTIIANLENLPQQENLEVGSGMSLSLMDLIIDLKEQSQSKSKLMFGAVERRANEPMDLKADISKLKQMGWTPKWKLSDGFQKTLNSFK